MREIARKREVCCASQGKHLHDHVKNACKYVKPFTPNKEEKKEEEEEAEKQEEEEERREEHTTEKGEVCECVRMRLSANDARKERVPSEKVEERRYRGMVGMGRERREGMI